jgi:8-oxo-dGTP pyrophosphatase MutT (NUDIX family)
MEDVNSLSVPVRHVVTCFILHNGRVLLLKRSKSVGSFRGRWAGVSGFIETEPLDQAIKEIQEETGLKREDFKLLKTGDTLTARDAGYDWVVHPFLFELVTEERIRLDWEHDESCWIKPADMKRYRTVPLLEEVFNQVYPIFD